MFISLQQFFICNLISIMFEQSVSLRQSSQFHEQCCQQSFVFATFQSEQNDQIIANFQKNHLSGFFQHQQQQVNNQEISQFDTFLLKPRKEKKKRIRKYTSKNPKNQKGHWTYEQNLKYHYFLQLNAKYFLDKERRKIDKIFKAMADFIQTRQAYQCRSRYQKSQKKWQFFTNILLNLRLSNFKTTDPKYLIKQLEKMGFDRVQILKQEELLYQEELLKQIFCKNNSETSSKGDKLTEERSNQIQIDEDKKMQDNMINCINLVMSQNYQDNLTI